MLFSRISRRLRRGQAPGPEVRPGLLSAISGTGICSRAVPAGNGLRWNRVSWHLRNSTKRTRFLPVVLEGCGTGTSQCDEYRCNGLPDGDQGRASRADRGDAAAALALGFKYEKGEGVTADLPKAYALLCLVSNSEWQKGHHGEATEGAERIKAKLSADQLKAGEELMTAMIERASELD